MLPGLCGIMAGLGRVPVELVASAVDTTNRSGSYTFAGLNFGEDFTGRTIIAVTFLMSGSGGQVLNQTSCTIGGVSAEGDDRGDSESAPLVGSCGTGIWAAKPSGTSGTVTVNFATGTSTVCQIYILAVADAASATPFDITVNPELASPDGGAASSSTTIDVPSDGVVVFSLIRVNTNNLALTGVTERIQETVSTSFRVVVGWDSRLPSQTARTVGYTSTGNAIFGGMCATFT